jgi:hypothetical protein
MNIYEYLWMNVMYQQIFGSTDGRPSDSSQDVCYGIRDET